MNFVFVWLMWNFQCLFRCWIKTVQRSFGIVSKKQYWIKSCLVFVTYEVAGETRKCKIVLSRNFNIRWTLDVVENIFFVGNVKRTKKKTLTITSFAFETVFDFINLIEKSKKDRLCLCIIVSVFGILIFL